MGQHGSLILTSTDVLGVVGLDEHGSRLGNGLGVGEGSEHGQEKGGGLEELHVDF